ncbi:MAG: FAD-dependent oxidoreductase, partial [Planctomycetota bacterium]
HEVAEITGNSQVAGVKVGDEVIKADIVVMGAGVRADTELAGKSGLIIGEAGGIRVDEKLMTSEKDIFAAGDCVEYPHIVSGKPQVCGLGTIAMRQGLVAGTNAAGGNTAAPPVLGATILKLFDVQIGSVGLTEAAAKEANFTPVSITSKHSSLPHYYPGGVPVTVRLIADKNTQRILGAQFLAPGETGVAQRVNAMSLAIMKQMTLNEIINADFCYSPPCTDIWSAEAVAAQTLLRRLQR